jgi:alpha-1,2-mannosyltransferase
VPATVAPPSPPGSGARPGSAATPPASANIAAVLRRPGPTAGRIALVAVNIAAVTFFLLSWSRTGVGFGAYHIDLDVYRIGGRVWWHGGDLYGRLPATRAGARLPFTYPPVAAVVFAPLALVPYPVAATALTLATVVSLTVVLRMFLRRLSGPAAGSPWVLAWLLPPALFFEPVRDTLGFGQINAVLMALVSADCLARSPRWPRGALTGLAAAVKLTPAAFVLYFLLRRDYRAAGWAGLSFAVATAAGFAAAGPDSAHYWTSTLLQGGRRAGNPASASNQCIVAVLARAGLDPRSPAGLLTWLTLAALVVVAASRGMRPALAAGQDCLALSLNAFAALLISPVSWSHHWVWFAPALLTIATLGQRYRSRLAVATVTVGLAVFAAAPQFWFRHGHRRELHWALWQQAAGSSYVVFAVLILALAGFARIRRLVGSRPQPESLRPGEQRDRPVRPAPHPRRAWPRAGRFRRRPRHAASGRGPRPGLPAGGGHLGAGRRHGPAAVLRT